MTYKLSIAFLLTSVVAAHAADNGTPNTDRYATVIQAQYASQTPPTTLRADEAQRIYDAYLKSIGQKSKDLTTSVSDSTDNPVH